MSSKTVCILHGVAEGPRISRHFREELEKSDYEIITNSKVANVIIAHSGGCFVIPKDNTAQGILMIDIPYWPGNSILKSLGQKFFQDLVLNFRLHRRRLWLQKTLWNGLYMLNLARTYKMLNGRRRETVWDLRAPKTILIRNQEDTFCTPEVEKLPFKHKPTIVHLPGSHDDCWINPEPYIKLLETIYEAG